LFQHTRITTTGTLVGTDAQFVTLSNLPRCIVGGMVGAKIVGENTNTITVFARSVHGDSVGDNNIFQVAKLMASDPDYIELFSFWEQMANIGNAPFICSIGSAFSLGIDSDSAGSTGTVLFDIGLLSLVFQHTAISAVGTLAGTAQQTVDLDEMPKCVVGGMIGIKVEGENGNAITCRIRSIHRDAANDDDLYAVLLNVGSDPDYFPLHSVFEDMANIANAPFMCTMGSSLRLQCVSNNAGSTGTCEFDIGFVSFNTDP
jgi:hypothetical protein